MHDTLTRLRADFLSLVEGFHANPAVARLTAGLATREEYASLLRSIAHHTKENPQIQAVATGRFRGDQRRFVKPFLRHAISEIGHDQLAIDDLAVLGGETRHLQLGRPTPAVTCLNAFAYHTIEHNGVLGYLGYLFFLEFLPTTFGADYLAALDRMGIPQEARSFLMDHTTVDVGHNKLMESYLGELVRTEDDYEQVRYALEVTAWLYACLIEQAFAQAAQPGTRHRDPVEVAFTAGL